MPPVRDTGREGIYEPCEISASSVRSIPDEARDALAETTFTRLTKTPASR